MGKELVVAFAFGVPSSIRSNLCIAQIALNKARKIGAGMIYTQRDIEIEPNIAVTRIEEAEEKPHRLFGLQEELFNLQRRMEMRYYGFLPQNRIYGVV